MAPRFRALTALPQVRSSVPPSGSQSVTAVQVDPVPSSDLSGLPDTHGIQAYEQKYSHMKTYINLLNLIGTGR